MSNVNTNFDSEFSGNQIVQNHEQFLKTNQNDESNYSQPISKMGDFAQALKKKHLPRNPHFTDAQQRFDFLIVCDLYRVYDEVYFGNPFRRIHNKYGLFSDEIEMENITKNQIEDGNISKKIKGNEEEEEKAVMFQDLEMPKTNTLGSTLPYQPLNAQQSSQHIREPILYDPTSIEEPVIELVEESDELAEFDNKNDPPYELSFPEQDRTNKNTEMKEKELNSEDLSKILGKYSEKTKKETEKYRRFKIKVRKKEALEQIQYSSFKKQIKQCNNECN